MKRVQLSLILFVMGLVLTLVVLGLLGSVMMPEIVVSLVVGLLAAIVGPPIAIRAFGREKASKRVGP